LFLNPIGLFTSVTFTVAPFVSVRSLAILYDARLRFAGSYATLS
jgi:hypothetical protein